MFKDLTFSEKPQDAKNNQLKEGRIRKETEGLRKQGNYMISTERDIGTNTDLTKEELQDCKGILTC
jgi:hypothetical protein